MALTKLFTEGTFLFQSQGTTLFIQLLILSVPFDFFQESLWEQERACLYLP